MTSIALANVFRCACGTLHRRVGAFYCCDVCRCGHPLPVARVTVDLPRDPTVVICRHCGVAMRWTWRRADLCADCQP